MDDIPSDSGLYMQAMTKKALDWADLSFERAFAIDEVNIGQTVEDYSFIALVEKFYHKVYEDELLRGLFSADLERNVQNLADYLHQRCGGPVFYTDRQGIPNLGQRHQDYHIDQRMVERWLHLMEESLDESTSDFSENHRQILLDHMRYIGYSILVWSDTYSKQRELGGLFLS